MNTQEPIWKKVPDAAKYFSIPKSRMYDLINQGVLPAVRIGQRSIRVDVREVERVLREDHQVAPR
jgi:excisionase family DNA binding protein